MRFLTVLLATRFLGTPAYAAPPANTIIAEEGSDLSAETTEPPLALAAHNPKGSVAPPPTLRRFHVGQGFGVAGTILTAGAFASAPVTWYYGIGAANLMAPMAAGGALGAGIALRRRGSPVTIVPGSIAMGASVLPIVGTLAFGWAGPGVITVLGIGGPIVAVVGSAIQLGLNGHAARHLSESVATGGSVRLTATPRVDGGFEAGLTGRF